MPTQTGVHPNTLMDFASPMTEIMEDVADLGHKLTFIMQGGMGWGESASVDVLRENQQIKNNVFIYVDCSTKSDSGDFYMIKYSADGTPFTTVPHEELGMHLAREGKYVLIFFDEIGKMPRSAFNSVLRVLYERKAGNESLSESSVVYAATNMASEGLGDVLPAHGRNRCGIRTVAVPTCVEWLSWAIRNGIHEFLQSYANDNKFIFTSFLQHEVGEHPEIYDPRSPDVPVAFVTGRSLEKASELFYLYDKRVEAAKQAQEFTEEVNNKFLRMVKNALVGVVGPKAATDMMTYFRLRDDIPSEEVIKANPMTAPIPKSGAARALLMTRSLRSMTKEFAGAWMSYLLREGAGEFTKIDQAIFGIGSRVKGYPPTRALTGNDKYQVWARENASLFGKV